jgi:hypothetical protein
MNGVHDIRNLTPPGIGFPPVSIFQTLAVLLSDGQTLTEWEHQAFRRAGISARTQSIRDEEDDRATNRRYPEEEHIQAKHKVCRAVL